ncbi:conserved hypothetical protein [Gloeothece citriformis PCC 7424]|uniref:Uncharacterized protein n=1 Tax=Gloeothece citriformis (strain PCC 7424) TaxID=65393 RepID=B7K8Z0_GLOC7|nr:SHOCT domain-containing protein [Gloeothece citriformis]ACK72759.1 conserved hypothetical protein [Gloeothece citriformis PCC 7424]
MFEDLFNKPKNRKIAVFLALLGSVLVLPIPIAGIHKFYLGQPLWGILYLVLWQTPIPKIACAIDAVWYLVQDSQQFNVYFNLKQSINDSRSDPSQIKALASALRELDQLRAEGLLSEYEFEQKRRQLLEHIS